MTSGDKGGGGSRMTKMEVTSFVDGPLVHDKKKAHKCEFCDKSLSTANYLKIHVESIHFGLKNQSCEICSKSF